MKKGHNLQFSSFKRLLETLYHHPIKFQWVNAIDASFLQAVVSFYILVCVSGQSNECRLGQV